MSCDISLFLPLRRSKSEVSSVVVTAKLIRYGILKLG